MMLQNELVQFTVASGVLTDELTGAKPSLSDSLDARILDEGGGFSSTNQDYAQLQKLRGQVRLARGVVTTYAPDLSPAVRGQLYAWEAYAEIMLADLFCSGVPLSTVDYGQNFTYAPSSTTTQIYQHANVLLDSALALVADSADLQTLIQVGKGRALLAIGQYQQAADDVSTVPSDAAYRIRISFRPNAVSSNYIEFGFGTGYSTVANREGQNGQPYISSGDPRTKADTATFIETTGTLTIHYPSKYRTSYTTQHSADSVLFTLADGVEARLIQAEAALHAGDVSTWLTTLNALRTDGSFTTAPSANPDSAGVIDTTWNAGTGGVAGLKPLTDPGSPDARVNTMFAERAAWLFFTGHRLGDLRRFSRQYGRDPDSIFPTGQYLSGQSPTGLYGTDVNVPIPSTERINPYFHGCQTRDP
jgi:hypothetical protein